MLKLQPELAKISDRISDCKKINEADKELIRNECLRCSSYLNEAKHYELIVGKWQSENDVYSAERKEAAKGKTILNETLYTIVSFAGRRKEWIVYFDLPEAYFY